MSAGPSTTWRGATTPTAGLPPGVELEWLGTAGFRLAGRRQDRADRSVREPGEPGAVAGPVAAAARLTWWRCTSPPGSTPSWWATPTSTTRSTCPAIAARDGCPVYGSASLAHLMGLHGRRELGRSRSSPTAATSIGPFTVTLRAQRHSRLLRRPVVPSDGELTCDHLDELTAAGATAAARCGASTSTVAGVQPLPPGLGRPRSTTSVRHRGVDVFLCGIAGPRGSRPATRRGSCAALEPAGRSCRTTGTTSSGRSPRRSASAQRRLHRFPDEVAGVSRSFALRTLRPLEPIAG